MPPQPQQRSTFSEQYNFAQWLTQFPALTVMVLLRRDLGFRLMDPYRLIAVTGVVFVASALFQTGNANDTNSQCLMLFAIGAFVAGIIHRIRGSWKFYCGIRQHSYYMGNSILQFKRWPDFVRVNRRVERFVDPIFCLIVGWAFYPVSHALSVWLAFSALSLRFYEFAIHKRDQNIDLDTIDGMIVAERQSQIVEHFENAGGTAPRQPSPGIPTGLGQDVEQHIKNRKN